MNILFSSEQKPMQFCVRTPIMTNFLCCQSTPSVFHFFLSKLFKIWMFFLCCIYCEFCFVQCFRFLYLAFALTKVGFEQSHSKFAIFLVHKMCVEFSCDRVTIVNWALWQIISCWGTRWTGTHAEYLLV